MIGRQISHYKIIEKLGEGGMGVVYKAEDIKLKRTVALKFLPSGLTADPISKERFIQEAQAASALDHPNICNIHEINETDDGQFYIVMAYYEGETLKNRIISGESVGAIPRITLKIDECINIAIQIAEGLGKAHEKGIIHRDIKPANIIVTADGTAKILDFGLAKLGGQTLLTKTGTTVGTAAYMSPEQARGEEVDHRTDIWSFGVVLYEMITGQLPFKGEYEQAVIYSIINEEPESLKKLCPEVSSGLEQIVFKALGKDPEKRYQRFEEMLDDLTSITAGILPDEIKARLRRARIAKRKRALLFSGTAAFILITVFALSLFTRRAETIGSVAVLPLENLTGDTEKEYFVDGVTDELIGCIARISGLRRVISRTSIMRYKNADTPVPEIARELDVDAVVEGTVYQVGEKVRLRLQLIDALPEERSLWTETYERPGSEVLMMYGEIARTIAGKLQVKLTAAEETRFAKARQVDPEAYAAYLNGMSHWYKLTPPDLEAAQKYFESALKKDPDYALAYLGMSSVFRGRAQLGLAPPQELRSEARRYLLKAMELDNSSAEAHYAMASLKTWHEWDWAGGEASFRRAIELNPNYAMARVYYSNLLCFMDRPEEALAQGQRALELDPINPLFMAIYGLSLSYLGKSDEAISQARNALRTSPDLPPAHSILWAELEENGEFDAALEEAKAQYAGIDLPQVVEALSRGHETGGYSGAMRAAAETLITLFPGAYYIDIGGLYLSAGDKEEALKWLEKAYEIRDPNLPYFGGEDTQNGLLRDDPRYHDLLRRMNLPAGDTK